jgi:hypothetical protein
MGRMKLDLEVNADDTSLLLRMNVLAVNFGPAARAAPLKPVAVIASTSNAGVVKREIRTGYLAGKSLTCHHTRYHGE